MTRLNRIRLALARPLLWYLSAVGTTRGKGFIKRRVLPAILPQPPASFIVHRPGGTKVRLHYREILGIAALVSGGFEDAECQRMLELALPGTFAIDVGANIGIHAIPLAARLAPGRLIAIEPVGANARRLLANASLNALENIDLHVIAAGSNAGRIHLHLARDAAFTSAGQVVESRDVASSIEVELMQLDTLWEGAGQPLVSLIKIDVEGYEAAVIRGAARLLSKERPAIVAEANTAMALRELECTLGEYGYVRSPAEGFEPWNHLFLPRLSDLAKA